MNRHFFKVFEHLFGCSTALLFVATVESVNTQTDSDSDLDSCVQCCCRQITWTPNPTVN